MTTLLFGGGSKVKQPIYTGLQVQTSAFNLPIPILFGINRCSFNVIWYNDFEKHKQSSGGKGGGKGGSYTYTAAVILALGEGIITNVPHVYMNQNTITTLAALNLSLMTGTSSQSPESFIVTKYPAEALSYANTAYLFSPKLDLGSSATIPSMGLNYVGLLAGTMAPYSTETNMADVISLWMTSPQFGMGLVSGNLDATSLAFYKTYIQAQGLFMSPALVSSEKCVDTLDRWAAITNSWIYWSGNVMKFVPLGDTPITANGVTYTPDTLIQYDVMPDDFINAGKDTDPIQITRLDPADAFNRTILSISDKNLQYNDNPIEYKDQTLVDMYGLRDNSNTQAHEITDPAVGLMSATLIGKRAAYLRNTYSFTLSYRFARLEPGDLISLTHPWIQAIDHLPVRVVSVDENDNGDLAIVCEEFPGTIGTFNASAIESPSNNPTNQLVDPGNVNDPCILEPNSALATPAQVWVSVSGGANWGGADVYVAFGSPTTFSKIGTISGTAKQGLLTSTLPSHVDPDNTNTLQVNLAESLGILEPVTHADADAFRSLVYVAAQSSGGVVPTNGELIAYGNVATTGTYTADLNYLRRALYGTTAASHATGQNFTLLDLTDATGSLLKFQLPSQYIGQTIYVKFVSFNIFGLAYQDISSVTTYQYTPIGAGFGGGSGGVPSTPTGLTATPNIGNNALNWNLNPTTDNALGYLIFRAPGLGASFGSSAQIGQVGSQTNTFIDTTVTAGAPYTYFIATANLAGFSAPSGGVNCTSSGVIQNALRISFSCTTSPAANDVLFVYSATGGESLPAGLTGSVLTCSVAPTSNWIITLKKNGSTVGTGTILAGQTSGTFTFSSTVTLATNDQFTGTAPATPDATIAGVSGTIIGTRAT